MSCHDEKPAAAGAAAPAQIDELWDGSDEGSAEEEDTAEEEQEEAEEGVEEAEEDPFAVPPPLPAAPAWPEDCFDCAK